VNQRDRVRQFIGLTAAVSAILTTVAGCTKTPYSEPASLADAQRIYSNTSWYWARTMVRLTNLSDSFTELDQTKAGDQLFMVSTNRTRIVYTELQPRRGLLSWRGRGQLGLVAGVAEPVYTFSRGSAKLQLVGFCAGRMFKIEAEGSSEPSTLSDAVLVATNAWYSLKMANGYMP
jgi:hypothetical protein